MSWQGEEIFSRMFGLRGMKCLLYYMFEQENRIRELEGKQPVTWQQALAVIEAKMVQFADDDNGTEEF